MQTHQQRGGCEGIGPADFAIAPSAIRHSRDDILLGGAAYKELRDDQHPVMVIAAADIARILTDAGLRDEAAVSAWLRESFPKPEDRQSVATSGI